MTTRKEKDRWLTAAPSNYTAEVVLGRAEYGARAAVEAHLRTSKDVTQVIGFTNPLVLRDIAADLNAAARYLEDEQFKALTEAEPNV